MKSRGLVGQKIVRVLQGPAYTSYGRLFYEVRGFELDNGDLIYFSVHELEWDYAVEGHVVKAKNRKG